MCVFCKQSEKYLYDMGEGESHVLTHGRQEQEQGGGGRRQESE